LGAGGAAVSTPRLGHLLAIPLLGFVLGFGGGAIHLITAAAPCTAATYTSHVTLVVEHGDGRVVGLCIGFDGSSLGGAEVLQASGLEYATGGYGSLGEAVCQIDDEPASYSSCLPSSGPYWTVFVARAGGGWEDAASGISTLTFASGDAEGFRYDPQDGPDPPPASPAGICAAALATPSSGATGAGGGSGSRAGAASPPATGARTAPASTPAMSGTAAAQAGAAGPAAGVIAAGDDRPRTGSGSTPPAAAGSGLSPPLLVLAAVLGVLAGLLGVQLVLRRRRT
jgi:hypothetical protein